MPYKVICEEQNYQKSFDDCVDAQLAYNSHYREGHNVSLIAIPPETYETYKKCLEGKGAFNSAFRIYQKPLGSTLSIPTGGDTLSHKSILENNTTTPEKPPTNDGVNSFFKRLVKLVPSEIIALYIALYGVIPKSEDAMDNYGNLIFISALILLFISRLFGTKITGYNTFKYFKTTQYISIGISAISFVIWVLALGHEIPLLANLGKDPIMIQIIMIIWTFAIPIFYKGEE